MSFRLKKVENLRKINYINIQKRKKVLFECEKSSVSFVQHFFEYFVNDKVISNQDKHFCNTKWAISVWICNAQQIKLR